MIRIFPNPVLNILVAGFIIIGGFAASIAYDMFVNRRLRRYGSVTTAQIVKKGEFWWSKNTLYYIIYQFKLDEAGERIYTRQQSVSGEHYKVWKEGSQVMVIYLPDKPTTSRLTDTDVDNTNRNIAIARIFIFLLFLILLIIRLTCSPQNASS